MAPDNAAHEESLSSVVATLQKDFVRLLDAEKALARAEIDEKLRELKSDALLAVGGAILAGLFLLCLVAAAIMALSLAIAPWAAALIIGGVLGATGLSLMVRFKSQIKHLDPVPRRTAASVKRDFKAVREAVR